MSLTEKSVISRAIGLAIRKSVFLSDRHLNTKELRKLKELTGT
jgi:hypothetical protein